ncbi:MAG: beta-lactamase family protein, partial [Gemmatimonadaceae bacterium]|nr:beta-lactamase family protein [Gemmatimonadaceae bacterium]
MAIRFTVVSRAARAQSTLFLAAAAAFLSAATATAAAQSVPPDSAILAILRTRVDSGRAPGIVVGIVEQGRPRFIAYGTAGDGRPMNDQTILEIGSISKTFTGLLLAEAVIRGEAQLDQPVVELLGNAGVVPMRDGKAITLEHLATHRSGLPRLPANLAPADVGDPYADYDAQRLHAFLASHALTRAPGDSAEYSNLGTG